MQEFRKDDQRWLQDMTNRFLAELFVTRIKKSRIRPNHVTYASFFVGMFVVYMVAAGMKGVLPSLCLFLSLVLDSADGQLARAQRATSILGDLLDKTNDRIKESFLLIAITTFLAKSGSPQLFNLLGIMDVFLLNFLYFYLEILKKYSVDGIKSLSLRNSIIRNIISFGYGERIIYASVLIALGQFRILLILYFVGILLHLMVNSAIFLFRFKKRDV